MSFSDQVSSFSSESVLSGRSFGSWASSFGSSQVFSGLLAAGSGLTPTGESGNSSANVLVAPRIGLLSGDRYSALTLGNKASAVDFNTSFAKLVPVSVFLTFLGGSRFGVWNSCFLTLGLNVTFLVGVG